MMKNNDWNDTALPICVALGVALGTALDNLPMGIAVGSLAGVVLSGCGLFYKHNEEDKEAE